MNFIASLGNRKRMRVSHALRMLVSVRPRRSRILLQAHRSERVKEGKNIRRVIALNDLIAKRHRRFLIDFTRPRRRNESRRVARANDNSVRASVRECVRSRRFTRAFRLRISSLRAHEIVSPRGIT